MYIENVVTKGVWKVSSKIWVSFAEYSLFYRVLLQKRPMFVGSLQIVATHTKCSVERSLVTVDTRWRRPIGYLKLQVIFRQRVINHRALLWNMTYNGSSPPCMQYVHTRDRLREEYTHTLHT